MPVRLFGATKATEVRFHVVHKADLVPIGYDKVRPVPVDDDYTR